MDGLPKGISLAHSTVIVLKTFQRECWEKDESVYQLESAELSAKPAPQNHKKYLTDLTYEKHVLI